MDSLTHDNIEQRLEANVAAAAQRVRRIEARYAHLLESGRATEAEIKASRRHPTNQRIFSAVERAERELADWQRKVAEREQANA